MTAGARTTRGRPVASAAIRRTASTAPSMTGAPSARYRATTPSTIVALDRPRPEVQVEPVPHRPRPGPRVRAHDGRLVLARPAPVVLGGRSRSGPRPTRSRSPRGRRPGRRSPRRSRSALPRAAAAAGPAAGRLLAVRRASSAPDAAVAAASARRSPRRHLARNRRSHRPSSSVPLSTWPSTWKLRSAVAAVDLHRELAGSGTRFQRMSLPDARGPSCGTFTPDVDLRMPGGGRPIKHERTERRVLAPGTQHVGSASGAHRDRSRLDARP